MVVELHAAATSEAISRSYVRRAPEHGALPRVVREHLQTFLWEIERDDDERGAPLFVKREFQRFVRCSVLAHGFARFRWTDCGTHQLVAFSWKGRGFCCATALLSRVFNLNFIFSAIADLALNLRAKLPFFPAIFMDRLVGLGVACVQHIIGWPKEQRRIASCLEHAECLFFSPASR